MNLAEAYCLQHRCAEHRFSRRLFLACLHRRALPLVPFVSLVRPGFFALEAELLARAGRCTSLRELDQELSDYRHDPRQSAVLRSWFRARLSTRRLRRQAVQAFAGAAGDRCGPTASVA